MTKPGLLDYLDVNGTINSSNIFGDFLFEEDDMFKALLESLRNKTSGHDWRRLFSEYTNLYLMPVIIFTGLCSNSLSFIVFTCTYLKMKSSSIYLAALSAVDAGFLLCLFFIWLARVNVPLFHMPGWCELLVYLNHVFCFLSPWSVVGFTSERYIAVYHPLRKDRYCGHRAPKLLITVSVIFAFLIYIYIFWTTGVRRMNSKAMCMPLVEYYDLLTVLTFFDTFLAFLLPTLLIVVLNIRIMLKLRAYQELSALKLKQLRSRDSQTRRSLPGTSSGHKLQLMANMSWNGSMQFTFVSRTERDLPEADFFSSRNSASHIRKNISQYRTARILLLVSTVYLILNSPNHIFKMHAFVHNLVANTSRSTKKLIIWQELFQLVYFLNFGINFFIYSFCSKTFRAALKRLLWRCKNSLKVTQSHA